MPACLVVWLVFGAYGTVKTVGLASSVAFYYHSTELTRREVAWSPIYGFASQCAAHLLSPASVLLIDPNRGAASDLYGAPSAVAPIDAGNAVALMYALYPRSVTAESDPARTSRMVLAAYDKYDYVAVWRQQSHRTAQARAAAAASQRMASLGAASLACSTKDTDGDAGALYAVSPRARSAQSALARMAPTPLASLSLAALIRAVLGLIGLWGIGMMLTTAVGAIGRARVAAALVMPLGIPVGCLAMGVEMLAASWLGIPWSLPVLGLPWLLLALLLGIALRGRCADALRTCHLPRAALARPPRIRSPRTGSTLALVLLGALVTLVIGIALHNLPYGDGFHFYFFKAKAFYLDHSVAPYFQAALHDQDTALTIPAHPPLMSLGVTWLYMWMGQVNEHVALLLWPALYFSALGLFFGVMRECVNGAAAAWMTLALAACAYQVTGNAAAGGYTDMPLAAFLLMGCLLLWRRLTAPTSKSELVLAGLLLGALPLVKEEGLPLSLFAIAAFVGVSAWQRGHLQWRAYAQAAWWLGLPWLLTVIPSLLIKVIYTPTEFLVAQRSRPIAALLTSFASSVIGFGWRALLYWLPVLVLLLVVLIPACVRRSRPCLARRIVFLLTVVGLQSLLDVVAMALSPLEVTTEVGVTAYRLILQVTPLLLLASVDLWLAASPRVPGARLGDPPSDHLSPVEQPAVAPR